MLSHAPHRVPVNILFASEIQRRSLPVKKKYVMRLWTSQDPRSRCGCARENRLHLPHTVGWTFCSHNGWFERPTPSTIHCDNSASVEVPRDLWKKVYRRTCGCSDGVASSLPAANNSLSVFCAWSLFGEKSQPDQHYDTICRDWT